MFLYGCVYVKFFSIIVFPLILHSLSTFSCNEYFRRTNLLAELIIPQYFDNDTGYYKTKQKVPNVKKIQVKMKLFSSNAQNF